MKYYVYERLYDLTEYPQEVLKKYGLEQGYYFYVGCSKEKNFRERCEKWKSHIIANYHVGYKIVNFIEKYKKFLECETNLTDKEINEELFYKMDMKYPDMNDEKKAKFIESLMIGIFRLFEELNDSETYRPKYFVLNDRGSLFKIKDNKVRLNRVLKELKGTKFIKSRKLEDYVIEGSRINDLY